MRIKNSPYTHKEEKPIVLLVSTPIGNKEDITLRALRIFKEADIVACEDTRNTGLLLASYQIKPKSLVSLYAQNEKKEAEKLVDKVRKNKLMLAYCSDAGRPGISDPGALLVQTCYEKGCPVSILPGATASLSALVLSGLDSADFSFFGFLPTKKGQIKSFLSPLKDRKESLIFYESPKRVKATLQVREEVFGKDRKVSLIRELTKIHEESSFGTIEEISASLGDEVKGECILIVDGNKEEKALDETSLKKRIKEKRKEGKSLLSLSKELSTETNIPKNTIYKLALERKK